MLIVTRKKRESVVIRANGVDVKVTVLRPGNSRIKLGVSAPPDVLVLRQELVDGKDKRKRRRVSRK